MFTHDHAWIISDFGYAATVTNESDTHNTQNLTTQGTPWSPYRLVIKKWI